MAEALINTRRGHRSYVTKLINTANSLLENFNEKNRFTLMSTKTSLQEKLQKLKTLDEQILSTLAEEEDINNEIDKSSDIEFSINECIFAIDSVLNKKKDTTDNSASQNLDTSASNVNFSSNGKLPSLSIKTFYGNPLEFSSFWDSFKAAIHENDSLKNITKFNYLISYLKGPAKAAISGISITESNYLETVELLEKRFGNKQIQITSNIDQLLSISPVNNINEIKKSRQLLDKVESTVRNLKSLDVDTKQYGPVLISIIMNKLPETIRLDITRSMSESTEWDVDALLEVLRKEINSRELCSYMSNLKSGDRDRPDRPNKDTFSAAALHSGSSGGGKSDSQNITCTYCRQNHTSSKCNMITDISSRKAILKSKGKCFVCLRSGHRASECKSTNKCYKCGSRHHLSICDFNLTPEKKKDNDKQDPNQTTMLALNKEDGVLLQTATAIVFNRENNNRKKNVRILFDNGSQKSFINQSLREKLKLKTQRSENKILKPFEGQDEKMRKLDIVNVCIADTKIQNLTDVELTVVPHICSPISGQSIELAQAMHEHLIDLPLADSTNGNSELAIDILIGGDLYWKFFSGRQKRGTKGPVAEETSLGWVLSGCVGSSVGSNKFVSTHILKLSETTYVEKETFHSSIHEKDQILLGEVKKFWEVEDIRETPSESIHSSIHDKSFDSLKSSINFENGRYTVQLPWKTDSLMLPDNFLPSKQRLISLLRRLKQKPELLNEYNEIISKQEKEGIIETVEDPKITLSGKTYYIPHREVVREDRVTTKTRIVYDPSTKRKGPSLNESLEAGPCLIPKVFDILLRCRAYKFLLLSDIQSAFLNIHIAEKDRDFLRFLWVDDIEKENPKIVVKRFNSLLFGLNCAPFLLGGTIDYHMRKYSNLNPENVSQFLSDLYMDDSISGKQTEEEAFEFYLFCKSVLKEGSFNLRKWLTNSENLQEKINDYEINFYGESEKYKIENKHKILGVSWLIKEDCLLFDFCDLLKEFIAIENVTKRVILKFVASIFDPLGVIAPAVVNIKLLFQKLCSLKIDWDFILGENLIIEWKALLSNLKQLKPIYLPRFYLNDCSFIDIKEIEMHGFSDASLKAYGCVIYLKFIFKNGNIVTKFLCSKTKINPLEKKSLTIPRLELMACTLLSSLIKNCVNSLSPIFNEIQIYCWSDSADCIYWINNTSKIWKQFIHSRVQKIRENLPNIKWLHCPGKLNPADIPSRGLNLSSNSNLKFWLNGPQFLLCTKELWPSQDIISYNSVNLIQEEKKVIENVIKLNDVICLSKFSSYDKLVRVLAYVKRFIFNCSKEGKNNKILGENVTSKEFSESEISLLSYEQQYFSSKEEFNHLFNSLNVFVDKDGLIKVKGRLQNSSLNPPILLNKDSYVTHLIIWNYHIRRLHSGVKGTLTHLRQRFWVPRGRQTVRKVIKDCFTCLKQNSKPFKLPAAPPLPTFRVKIDFPFAHTGVDYLGPLFVRNIFHSNDDLFKVHIALYTCASTRGVYLDVVPDASSRSFVNSMKRFVSRHGIPKFFISDNGKNFIGPEVKEYIRFLNTDWDYILEHSPWWGGFWERLVQLVKRSLRKILQKNKLTFEEMVTVVTEIEGILNTRPLCYIDDDSTDTIITPSHLIYGRNLLTKIPGDNDLNKNSYGKRFKHLQTLINRFWKTWTSEYLTELRERHKNIYKTKGREIKLGELVLIKDEIIPRSRWRIGRVYKLHKGKDNKIRGAYLKVINDKNNTHVNRPVTKLCPLEVHCELREDNQRQLDDPTPKMKEDNSLQRYLESNRPKRTAAVTGILKRL